MEFGESETLLPTRVSRPLPLRHTSSPEKWIYSAPNNFSEAVVWPVIYGGLSCRGITSHSYAACGEPSFLCVPVPVGDFLPPSEISGMKGIRHRWDDLVCKLLCF